MLDCRLSFSKSKREVKKLYGKLYTRPARAGFVSLDFLLLGQVNSLPVVILLEAESAKSTHHDTAQFIGCQNATCLLTQLIGLIYCFHHPYKPDLICLSAQENPHHRSPQTHNVHQHTHGLTTKMAMFCCDWISFLFSSALVGWLTATKSDGALHNDVELHATHLSAILH